MQAKKYVTTFKEFSCLAVEVAVVVLTDNIVVPGTGVSFSPTPSHLILSNN